MPRLLRGMPVVCIALCWTASVGGSEPAREERAAPASRDRTEPGSAKSNPTALLDRLRKYQRRRRSGSPGPPDSRGAIDASADPREPAVGQPRLDSRSSVGRRSTTIRPSGRADVVRGGQDVPPYGWDSRSRESAGTSSNRDPYFSENDPFDVPPARNPAIGRAPVSSPQAAGRMSVQHREQPAAGRASAGDAAASPTQPQPTTASAGGDSPSVVNPFQTNLQSPEYQGVDGQNRQNAGDRYRYLPQPGAAPRQSFIESLGLRSLLPGGVRGVATWIPSDDDNLGWTDFAVTGAFGTPITGMTVTPGFQTHILNGPTTTDLPAQLYNAWAEVKWTKQFRPGLGLELAVAPGVYSDFERGDSDAVRIISRAVAFLASSQQTQWVIGATYVDRENISVLPIVGVIHAPSADSRLELIFPRPRLLMRVQQAPTHEQWMYVSGEFGGGSWSIVRAAGASDVVTYSDWRLLFGFEQKYANGRSFLVETGLVFNRQVEYRSAAGDFDPDAAVLMRAGLNY